MKNVFFSIFFVFSLLQVQFAGARDIVDIFDPFQIKTHKKLIKKFGAKEVTALYHDYIEEKGITDNCEELIGSCDYYLCQEKNNHCGAKGYFLAFGYQYCSDSLKRLSFEMSPRGRKWLNTTAVCLQKKIQAMDLENRSCKEIQRAAIKSHDKCYNEISFCSLSFNEIKKVIKMILPSLTKRGVMIEGVQVLKNCVSRKR